MKIEILSMFNLNSLSGKSVIRFDSKPFNGSGLFAITGPTGAGKSTIFDAICLALYGRTPRLKNPDEIMTRHSGECFAELTFSISGRSYRSRWEQRRSRGKSDGKLQGSKMSVVIVEERGERILEEKKSAVPQLISSITGLDYDQFTRSILLAQGNFASFLKAGVNERAELLEKMTGSELYTRLSIEAFNRAKEEEDMLVRLKEKMGDAEVLDFQTREEIKQELTQLINKKVDAAEKRTQYSEAKNWVDQEIVLKLRVDNFRYDLETARQKAFDSERLNDEYEKKRRILANMPLYESSRYLKEELKKLSDETDRLQKRRDVTILSLENLKNESDKLNEGLLKARDEEEDLQKQIRSIELKENTLDSIARQLKKHLDEENELKKQLNSEAALQISYENELDQLNHKSLDLVEFTQANQKHEKINQFLPLLRDLSKRFSELQIEQTIPLNELERISRTKRRELEQIGNKISLIKEEKPGDLNNHLKVKEILLKLIPVSHRYREADGNKEISLKNKISYLSVSNEIESEVRCLNAEYDKLISLKEKREYNSLVSEIRNHLHEGETCPVCNGVYHKSDGNMDNTVSSEDFSAIDNLGNIENRLKTLHGKNEVLKQQLSDCETEKVKYDKLLDELHNEWNEIKGEYFPGLHPADRDKANSIYAGNEEKIADCNNWQLELENLIKDEQALKSSSEEHILGARIAAEMIDIYSQYGIDAIEVLEPLKILENQYEAYIKKKNSLDLIRNEMSSLESRLNMSREKLNTFRGQDIKLTAAIEQLNDENRRLADEIRAIAEGKTIDELKMTAARLIENAERSLNEAQKKLNGKKEERSSIEGALMRNREQLPQLEVNCREKEKQFLKILSKENLSLEDFKADDLSSRVEILKKTIDGIKENQIRAEEAYTNAQANLNDHYANKPKDEILMETASQLEAIDKEIEESSRNIGIIEERLNRDDAARKQLRQLSEEVEAREKECLRWAKLRTLIGSADGKVYRRFVQGLTLEKLIRLANRHLEKLNNRYRIERSRNKELEIEIVDSWQADTIRPAATLSGGESFLVSLALSLGLSELVGNKVVIDSLFLDEGFGTLDPDSLEIVLSALETLQSGGKLIGIISHIEAIRERISVQIRVKKLAGGKSIIEIV